MSNLRQRQKLMQLESHSSPLSKLDKSIDRAAAIKGTKDQQNADNFSEMTYYKRGGGLVYLETLVPKKQANEATLIRSKANYTSPSNRLIKI